MYNPYRLAMLDKTLGANSSKISRKYEKLPQRHGWLPKSKELIHKLWMKTPSILLM
jgi:hypothetical protein